MRSYLIFILTLASVVAQAEIPKLPEIKGNIHLRYRTVTRFYSDTKKLNDLKNAKHEEEVVQTDLYLGSSVATSIREVLSDTRKDPLLNSSKNWRQRIECRPNQATKAGKGTVLVYNESHPEYLYNSMPLFGIHMPYAKAIEPPPVSDAWKVVDGKDDPSTRCGVPMPVSSKEGPYAYWVGHFKVKEDRLNEFSIISPEALGILRTYDDYRSFESLSIAHHVIETHFVNNSHGGRFVQPVEKQIETTLEVIERDLHSLPSWNSEVDFNTQIIVYQAGKRIESFPFNSGKLKFQDGEGDQNRPTRFMFGAVTTGVVATGLVGAFWGRIRKR